MTYHIHSGNRCVECYSKEMKEKFVREMLEDLRTANTPGIIRVFSGNQKKRCEIVQYKEDGSVNVKNN